MKINIDGREYSFKFQHNTGEVARKPKLGLKLSQTTTQERGTVCRIFNEAGEQVTYGVANVHPHDNYCKEKGRKIALARAMKTWDKEYRSQVWEEYRTWGAKDRW